MLESCGYEDTNIRAIAKESGVATGTVLMHFIDKRDLLFTALHEDFESVWEEALARAEEGSLDTRLTRVAGRLFNYYQEQPLLSRVVLKESMFADEPWRTRFNAQEAALNELVEKLVEDAIKRGELRKDVSSDLFAVSYLSFYYCCLVRWVQAELPEPGPMFGLLVRQLIQSSSVPKKG